MEHDPPPADASRHAMTPRPPGWRMAASPTNLCDDNLMSDLRPEMSRAQGSRRWAFFRDSIGYPTVSICSPLNPLFLQMMASTSKVDVTDHVQGWSTYQGALCYHDSLKILIKRIKYELLYFLLCCHDYLSSKHLVLLLLLDIQIVQ